MIGHPKVIVQRYYASNLNPLKADSIIRSQELLVHRLPIDNPIYEGSIVPRSNKY